MDTVVETKFQFSFDLCIQRDGVTVPLHHESVGGDLTDLVEETHTGGVLAGALPVVARWTRGTIEPIFSTEPCVKSVEVTLECGDDDSGATIIGRHSRRYSTGRWERRSMLLRHQLLEEGTVEEDEEVFSTVVAQAAVAGVELRACLQAPIIHEESLEEAGVRDLGEGSLITDRPILINARMVDEFIQWTEEAGANETGGAVLGKLIRLPEPLPGTTSRIVTVLTAAIPDRRHEGAPAVLEFSSEALAEAQQVAELRGLGETVITVFHSHGWGTGCDNCNENSACVLPQCTSVSLQDYQVLESLFPGKSTVMPIAGRKLGAAGRRPVLEVHAWRGGSMRPVRWQSFID